MNGGPVLGDSIYATLNAALSGTRLTLTPATFGASGAGIGDVLIEYFPPDGALIMDGVTLDRQGDAVSIAGAAGVSVPLKGMAIDAGFAPGPGGVQMTLTATPPAGWVFSDGWPLLDGDPLSRLSVTKATLGLCSVDVPTGAAKGITFTGLIGFPAEWDALVWLLGTSSEVKVSGTVGQRGTAPSFKFIGPVASLNLPVLGPLSVNLVASSTPVPAGPGPGANPYIPWTALQIDTEIEIAGTPVPIVIDLSVPFGTIPIVADVRGAMIKITALAPVLDGADPGSALPEAHDWEPDQLFTLETLSFALDARIKKVVSAGFTLGNHKPWPITPGLSAGPVTVTFLVQFAQQSGQQHQVFASLAGDVNFPGGSLGLGAYYPSWVFTGRLNPGSQVSLSALLSQVLSGAASLPDLVMDQLEVAVQPLKGGSFSLSTALTGNWSFPVGAATLALTGASLELDRQAGGNSGAGTSGTIAVHGTLTPPAGTGEPITFDGSLAVPGAFSLSGKIPDLHLTELAAKLSGNASPAGVPQVDLTSGEVAIVLDANTGDYVLAVAAAASVGGAPLGAAMFAVRRTPTAFGFLIGVVISGSWSPATTWPELGTIFGNLTISRPGLLISTLPSGSPINLPDMKMPSLPGTVSPGFTFFGTLELQGAILGPLAGLFDQGVALNLLAVVDTSTPKNSRFQAVFTGLSQNNQIAWTSVQVTITPDPLSLTIQAAATFCIQNEHLSVAGQGTINMEGPSAQLTLLVQNWQHPFGIANLVVKEFGLQIALDPTGVSIGLLGSFMIGTGSRTFTLVIGGKITDFEAPRALIFGLQSNNPLDPLMLTDVISQFTSLDLSSVPVLKAIGFKELSFAVVDDPAGFDIGTYHFPQGIGIAADIFVYTWEAKFGLQVSHDKGIVASGSISQPITLGEVLTFSDTTGKTGPSGSIDTSHLPARTDRLALEQLHQRRALRQGDEQPYFTLDGHLAFLGIEAAIKASAAGKTFDFKLDFAFLSTVTAHLACQLIDAAHFAAAASIGFNLDVTVGPYAVDGITLIPQVHIQSPGASVALGIKVEPPTTAELDLELKFSWAGSDYTKSFTLTAADIAGQLTSLWSAIKEWLSNHVGVLFDNFLKDASAWIEALKTVFKDLAQDIGAIANALAHYFKATAEDAAALLLRIGFAYLEVVNALVEYFTMEFDKAAALVESLYKECTMQTAEEQAYQGAAAGSGYTLSDFAFALTGSPAGQHLLEVYYGHQDEIEALLAPHPYLHDRLQAFAESGQRARDMRLLADTTAKALVTIAPEASPELSAFADELIPELMRYRDMPPQAVLLDLASQR